METLFTGCRLSDVVTVTDVGLKHLAALPNLVNLTISYSAEVSDAALEAVASRGKLQKLVCRGCLSFTDVGCIRYRNTLFIVIVFYLYLLKIRSRDSSVDIATGYGLDNEGAGSSSPGRVKNVHYSISSRPALGSTQSSLKWVPGALSWG
jgi:hypothetical protein